MVKLKLEMNYVNYGSVNNGSESFSLKQEKASLELLKGASSVDGGNIDLKRFDLQQKSL